MNSPITIQTNKPGKRHSDALLIQDGACNPRAIARSLVAAMAEIDVISGPNVAEDPAVRLIAHQLAYILGVSQIDNEDGEYRRLIDACRASKAALETPAYFVVDDVIDEAGHEGFEVMHGNPYEATGTSEFKGLTLNTCMAFLSGKLVPGETAYRVFLRRRHGDRARVVPIHTIVPVIVEGDAA